MTPKLHLVMQLPYYMALIIITYNPEGEELASCNLEGREVFKGEVAHV